MSYMQEYEKWLTSPALNEQEHAELESIRDDEKEIRERFYGPLEFGTAGLRGTMKVGLHQMNIHVIRWATQGFANVICAEGEEAKRRGLSHEEYHSQVQYIVAHGISSRLHGKKVLVGSYHFLFEDERIPLTEEQRLTIRNHARGKSNIFLAIGRRAIGMIGVSDPPRPEAAETIARLKRQGISSIIMLTGDSESAARAISRQLGITEYRSQVLPEDKARFIQQLKKSGKTVCMVGDGINDSPALSCADVSVSMKDSSDIAREVADISLLSSSLAELVVLRELSCAVLEKIERNYRFIIGFNSSLILLGMFGLITPDLSAFLHNASTVYVSARSTRRCLPPVRVPK